MKNKLPTEDGYLTLGNGQDAPRVVIGAYASQIPQVDAVVNAKVGEALGMRPGNALIVSTDPLVHRSPSESASPRSPATTPRCSASTSPPD